MTHLGRADEHYSRRQPGRHSLAARKDDLYETPPEAVRALLSVESMPEPVWELAAVRHPTMIVLPPLRVLETLSENPSFAA